MCRLFGFRSSLQSKVHSSLVSAENALMHQSPRHPDGWGVAYYVEDSPHVIRSLSTAIDDQLFQKVSGVVSSQTVIAHLRKKTIGKCTVLDTHPFQYGKWVFAHNGNLRDFDKTRPALIQKVDEELRPFILGSTDSEVIFYIILTNLKKIQSTSSNHNGLEDLANACQQAVKEISEIVGEMLDQDSGSPQENYLTFLISNGKILLGNQGGKTLHYSTHKQLCEDRDGCSNFSEKCETQVIDGLVSHLLFSSEPTEGTSIWTPMKFNQMIGIGDDMQLKIF